MALELVNQSFQEEIEIALIWNLKYHFYLCDLFPWLDVTIGKYEVVLLKAFVWGRTCMD